MAYSDTIKAKETRKKWREKNKERLREMAKVDSLKYRAKNRDKLAAKQREYVAANKNKIANYAREYRSKNRTKLSEMQKEYYSRNIDKIKLYAREYNAKPETKVRSANYVKLRRKNDPIFDMSCRLRVKLSKVFNYKKPTNTLSLVGIEFDGFKAYFESLFEDGMTWDNRSEWHIDHIVPLTTAKSEDELKMLCHYTNLQPLWANDNLRKNRFLNHLFSPWPRVA